MTAVEILFGKFLVQLQMVLVKCMGWNPLLPLLFLLQNRICLVFKRTCMVWQGRDVKLTHKELVPAPVLPDCSSGDLRLLGLLRLRRQSEDWLKRQV